MRANPTLLSYREQIADILKRVIGRDGTTTIDAVAAGLGGCQRTLVARWREATQADRRPAPMALLLALDRASLVALFREVCSMRAESDLTEADLETAVRGLR